jgi:hypothetical protein
LLNQGASRKNETAGGFTVLKGQDFALEVLNTVYPTVTQSDVGAPVIFVSSLPAAGDYLRIGDFLYG